MCFLYMVLVCVVSGVSGLEQEEEEGSLQWGERLSVCFLYMVLVYCVVSGVPGLD